MSDQCSNKKNNASVAACDTLPMYKFPITKKQAEGLRRHAAESKKDPRIAVLIEDEFTQVKSFFVVNKSQLKGMKIAEIGTVTIQGVENPLYTVIK
jgi:hypothetical protein